MNVKNLFVIVLFCLIAVPGCGGKEENPLATDGATADDFAKYEEELAAVSGEGSYGDDEGDDAE